jgi:hypothetical protein
MGRARIPLAPFTEIPPVPFAGVPPDPLAGSAGSLDWNRPAPGGNAADAIT